MKNFPMTSNKITLWFYSDNKWAFKLQCQLKRIFQQSLEQPTRIMIRDILMKDDDPVEAFNLFKNTTEIKICYVECGMLTKPESNEIIGELKNCNLKRCWIGFNKMSDYHEEIVAPFFEFEGEFSFIDNEPFADVWYSQFPEESQL